MRMIDYGSDGRGIILESAQQTTDFVMPVYPIGVQEALTAAAPACSVAKYFSTLDATSNAVAATLADGVINGQMKRVQAINVDNAVTLTLASAESTSLDVITFTVVGDYCELMWFDQDDDGAGYWKILLRNNEASTAQTPTAA